MKDASMTPEFINNEVRNRELSSTRFDKLPYAYNIFILSLRAAYHESLLVNFIINKRHVYRHLSSLTLKFRTEV